MVEPKPLKVPRQNPNWQAANPTANLAEWNNPNTIRGQIKNQRFQKEVAQRQVAQNTTSFIGVRRKHAERVEVNLALAPVMLVKPFKQGAYVSKYQDQEMKEGVCDALCVQWISMEHKQQDFWNFIETAEGRASIEQLQNVSFRKNVVFNEELGLEKGFKGNRKIHIEKLLLSAKAGDSGAISKRAKLEAAMRENKDFRKDFLEQNSDIHRSQRIACKDIADVITEIEHFAGYAHLQVGGKSGGHAIAVNLSKNGVQIMDPNDGKISMASKYEGIDALRDHLEIVGKKLDGMEEIMVELFPCAQPPGRLEQTIADGLSDSAQATGDSTTDSEVIPNSNN